MHRSIKKIFIWICGHTCSPRRVNLLDKMVQSSHWSLQLVDEVWGGGYLGLLGAVICHLGRELRCQERNEDLLLQDAIKSAD